MQNVQNRLFRKVALDRLSSPEQLDQLMQITSPRAWLALIAITILLVTGGLWAVFGNISEEVQANGVVTNSFEVVTYVSLPDSAELESGMAVEVEVSTLETDYYGYFEGIVSEVGRVPVSRQSVIEVAGNEELANAVMPNDLAIEVRVELKQDSNSSYVLTSGRRLIRPLSTGTPVTAIIIVDEKRPISRVFPMFE